MISEQIINQLTVMSTVIVQHEMWAIIHVAEASYHVSQELLEGDSVG